MPISARLDDRSEVTIRRIRPEDGPLIEMGFAQLSDRSRQFRFLRLVPRLSEAQLRELTHPVRPDDLAIGALAGKIPLGLARYLCLPADPRMAEVAITVVDAWQGRGLGMRLLACLARAGAAVGLESFVALVAADNAAMRGLLEDLGGQVIEDHGREREYRLTLHSDPARYPETRAGEVFREVYGLPGTLE